MFELQIFFQRRRKMLLRLTALVAVIVAGVLVVLPRAGAQGPAPEAKRVNLAGTRLLMSSASVASEQFALFYGPLHR